MNEEERTEKIVRLNQLKADAYDIRVLHDQSLRDVQRMAEAYDARHLEIQALGKELREQPVEQPAIGEPSMTGNTLIICQIGSERCRYCSKSNTCGKTEVHLNQNGVCQSIESPPPIPPATP